MIRQMAPYLLLYFGAVALVNHLTRQWILSLYQRQLSIDDEETRNEIIALCEEKDWTETIVEFVLEAGVLIGLLSLTSTWVQIPGPRFVTVLVIIAIVLPLRQYLQTQWAVYGKLPRVLRKLKRCPNCGYDLQEQERCPECGNENA